MNLHAHGVTKGITLSLMSFLLLAGCVNQTTRHPPIGAKAKPDLNKIIHEHDTGNYIDDLQIYPQPLKSFLKLDNWLTGTLTVSNQSQYPCDFAVDLTPLPRLRPPGAPPPSEDPIYCLAPGATYPSSLRPFQTTAIRVVLNPSANLAVPGNMPNLKMLARWDDPNHAGGAPVITGYHVQVLWDGNRAGSGTENQNTGNLGRCAQQMYGAVFSTSPFISWGSIAEVDNPNNFDLKLYVPGSIGGSPGACPVCNQGDAMSWVQLPAHGSISGSAFIHPQLVNPATGAAQITACIQNQPATTDPPSIQLIICTQ